MNEIITNQGVKNQKKEKQTKHQPSKSEVNYEINDVLNNFQNTSITHSNSAKYPSQEQLEATNLSEFLSRELSIEQIQEENIEFEETKINNFQRRDDTSKLNKRQKEYIEQQRQQFLATLNKALSTQAEKIVISELLLKQQQEQYKSEKKQVKQKVTEDIKLNFEKYLENINDTQKPKKKDQLNQYQKKKSSKKVKTQKEKTGKNLENLLNLAKYSFKKQQGIMYYIIKMKENLHQARTILKRKKHIKYILQEIIQSESRYIQYIKALVHLKNELITQQQFIIEVDQLSSVFSNIEDILVCNEQLLVQIQATFQEGDSSVIMQLNEIQVKQIIIQLGKVFQECKMKFGVYIKYCNDYAYSVNNFNRLKLRNEAFSKWLNQYEYKQQLLNQDVESLQIMPIQRIPKYLLFLRDILKIIKKETPEYFSVNSGLTSIEEFLMENDLNLANDQFTVTKLYEVQRIYGDGHGHNFLVDQQYITQEEFSQILDQDEIQKVKIVLLSQYLIIGTYTENYQILQKVQKIVIDAKLSVKDLPKRKYYNFMFSISVQGNSNIYNFMAESNEKKAKFINSLKMQVIRVQEHLDSTMAIRKTLLRNFESKFNYVTVIGSEERQSSQLLLSTFYVIQVKRGINEIRIFQRFSVILSFFEKIKEKFQNIIKFDSPDKTWLKAKKSKTIETRKIFIEQFIQLVVENYQFITQQIPEIRNVIYVPNEILGTTTTNELENEFNEELLQIFQNSFTSQISLQCFKGKPYLPCLMNIIIHQSLRSSIQQQEIEVILPTGDSVQVLISRSTTAYEVVALVSQKINLKVFGDYRLILKGEENYIKLIDDYEYIYTLINDQEDTYNNSNNNDKRISRNFSYSSSNSVSQFFSLFKSSSSAVRSQYQKICFIKYYYFPREIEIQEIYEDQMKIQLILAQLFEEIKQQVIKLKQDEYYLVGILYILYRGSIKNMFTEFKFKFKELYNVMPQVILEKRSKSHWAIKLEKCWENILLDIQGQIPSNQNEFLFKDKLVRQQKEFTLKLLLDLLYQQPTFATQLFKVQIFQKTIEEYSYLKLQIYMYLAIKYSELLLLDSQNKFVKKKFNISDIDTVESYPYSIIIHAQGQEYRFETPQSYEISELITFYKNLLE